MTQYIKSTAKLVLFLKGKPYTITAEHEKYDELCNMLENESSEDELFQFLDKKQEFIKKVENMGFYFDENDILYYNNLPVPIDLATLILSFHKEYGEYSKELELFIINLFKNPDYENISDLYSFLSKGNLPITDDGCFLAYKVVSSNFFDKHSNSFDNSPGKIVKMKREDCMLDRTHTCSAGLHFCSKSYISSFYSNGDIIVQVKVNPKDVTSIPIDYNQAKGRCCEYYVVGEVEEGKLEEIKVVESKTKENSFIKDVVEKVSNEIGKCCSKCKVFKFYELFPKDKSRKDGYHSQCKVCKNSKKRK